MRLLSTFYWWGQFALTLAVTELHDSASQLLQLTSLKSKVTKFGTTHYFCQTCIFKTGGAAKEIRLKLHKCI